MTPEQELAEAIRTACKRYAEQGRITAVPEIEIDWVDISPVNTPRFAVHTVKVRVTKTEEYTAA